MAFDPTKPVEDSPLDAAEMRDQFNGLKALIDAQQAQITALQAAVAGKASMPQMGGFNPDIHDPPTTADLVAFSDGINQLLQELQNP